MLSTARKLPFSETDQSMDSDVLKFEKRDERSASADLDTGPNQESMGNGQSNELLNDVQKIFENLINSASEDAKVIGIASPLSGGGASTILCMLSLIASARPKIKIPLVRSVPAARRKPTLIIDAQLRNPVLHEKFAVKSSPGLGDILSGATAWQDGVRTISSSLKMIPIGRRRDLFLHEDDIDRLRILIDNLYQHFNYIFLDLPPVLQFADGLTMSKLCDGVVLVVQAGKTNWEVVQETRRLLDATHVKIIGSILNRRKHHIPNWIYKLL